MTNLYAQPGPCATVGVSVADESALGSWLFRKSYVEPPPVCSQLPPSSHVPDVHAISNFLFVLLPDYDLRPQAYICDSIYLLVGVPFSALPQMIRIRW